ncbi:MAG: hypothetical protein ACR2MP_05825, partial [Streptosporangiaceae bacterium]
MAKTIRGPVDPVEREIETVLHPGRFIGDPACPYLANDLEQAAGQIEQLIRTYPPGALPQGPHRTTGPGGQLTPAGPPLTGEWPDAAASHSRLAAASLRALASRRNSSSVLVSTS